MKRIGFVIACAASALVLCSCSPKSEVIPTDPGQWEQLAKKTKGLSDEDRQLLAGYLVRRSMAGVLSGGNPSIPPGTTVGMAISEQKKFQADAKTQEAEADMLKAKAAAERAKAEAALNNAAIVTVVKKVFLPKNYDAGRFSERVAFVIAVQNKTGKDIAGVKGRLQFNDMFGTEIKSIGLSIDETVKAGQMFATSEYGMDVNQFEDGDTKLALTDLSKMKVIWHPEMVVFSDGTKMEAPAIPEGM